LFPRSAFQRLLKLLGPLLVQGLERLLGKDFDVFPLDRWNRALACLPTTPTLGTNWLPLAEIGATVAGLAGRFTECASRHGAADICVRQRFLVIQQRFADLAAQRFGLRRDLFLLRRWFLRVLRSLAKRQWFQELKPV